MRSVMTGAYIPLEYVNRREQTNESHVLSTLSDSLRRSGRNLLVPLLALLAAAAPAQTIENLKLPNLGESSTSLFSAEYEYQLGRAWLRIFRGQVPLVN